MSYRTKAEAEREGRKWLATMPKGKGWTLRVWDNMAWHFCLNNAPVSVYESSSSAKSRRFHTLIAGRADQVGSGTMDMHGVDTWGKTPTASVRKALRAFRGIMRNRLENWERIKAAIDSNGIK